MNLVMLCGCGPINTCFINSIARHHPIRHAFRVVWTDSGQSSSRWSKVARAPIRAVQKGLRRRFYNRFLASIESQAVHHLTGKETSPSCNVPSSSVDRLKINTEEFARSLRALEPDVLLISACPLLKPEIFEIPRLGTINVHRGIAPTYRGERTIFWPLYYQDFEHIGITLHLIDRGIDTGPVLAHGFPELRPDDTEATILAKSVAMAADLMGELLRDAKSGQLHGVRQAGDGRCFYGRDQRIWKDLSYLFLRIMRRRSIPSRPSRVDLYSNCKQQLLAVGFDDDPDRPHEAAAAYVLNAEG
jgi:folate-dependent phosphoribosylglycinamide formyltransferase PurN